MDVFTLWFDVLEIGGWTFEGQIIAWAVLLYSADAGRHLSGGGVRLGEQTCESVGVVPDGFASLLDCAGAS